MPDESIIGSETQAVQTQEVSEVKDVETAEGIKPEDSTKPDPEFAKRFASLTRREREVQSQADRHKAEIQEAQAFKQQKGLIKSNPVKFMEENGWKFEDLIDFVVNDQKITPSKENQALLDRIEKLEREKEDEKTSEKTKKENENIAIYKTNLKNKISEQKDKYELINEYDQFETVYETMNEIFQQTGEEPELDKVAEEVEKHIEQMLDNQFKAASNTSKFKSRFSPAQEPQQGSVVPGSERTADPKIVQNTDSNSSESSSRSSYLSEDESKRRSAKMLEDAWKRKEQALNSK